MKTTKIRKTARSPIVIIVAFIALSAMITATVLVPATHNASADRDRNCVGKSFSQFNKDFGGRENGRIVSENAKEFNGVGKNINQFRESVCPKN